MRLPSIILAICLGLLACSVNYLPAQAGQPRQPAAGEASPGMLGTAPAEAMPEQSRGDRKERDRKEFDRKEPGADRQRETRPSADGATPVPEPSTLFLVGTGIVGIALTVRRRRRLAEA